MRAIAGAVAGLAGQELGLEVAGGFCLSWEAGGDEMVHRHGPITMRGLLAWGRGRGEPLSGCLAVGA